MALTLEDVLAHLEPEEPDYGAAARLGPDALPHLHQLVDGPDNLLASKATYLAGMIAGDEQTEILIAASRNPHATVRVAAAAVITASDPNRRGILEQLVTDDDPGVRKVAMRRVAVLRPAGWKTRLEELGRTETIEQLRNLARETAKGLP
jgi:hypothetical protein